MQLPFPCMLDSMTFVFVLCRIPSVSRCFLKDINIEINQKVAEEQLPQDGHPVVTSCSVSVVQPATEISDTVESLDVPEEDHTYLDNLLTTLPVQSEEEQDLLAATPAHPAGLYALYASFLAGNLVEQIWNFAWPTAVALLHPSLLPVAVVGFVAKLGIFAGGPLVGTLMDSFPRVLAFNSLSAVQTAAQLISAGMIMYALNRVNPAVSSAASLLLQPWFIVLVLAGAVERLTGLASGVAFERDWVVLLAGTNRPIALARANAMLSRVDLLCEIAGASLYGILLAKFNPVTCLKLAAALMICLNPSIIGAFSGLCAFMGVAATFMSASLVKRLGILKAGAAGLIFQALLLGIAVAVYWSGSIAQQKSLIFFLFLVVLSRLGHMSYDIVGGQILQTAIPASQANLIGTTEVSMASLAELVMLGVAIIANDVSHFGFLAMLSMAAVAGAAWMYCQWLSNPTKEQRHLFSFDPHFDSSVSNNQQEGIKENVFMPPVQ